MKSHSQTQSSRLCVPTMSEDTLLPTRGQLERSLSQGLQALYRTQLGHKPGKIECEISEEKVVIVLEDCITKPEQLLAGNGQVQLAKQIRSELEEVIQPQIISLIEELVKAPVIDLLSDAKIDTGRTGTIAVLGAPPQVRKAAPA